MKPTLFGIFLAIQTPSNPTSDLVMKATCFDIFLAIQTPSNITSDLAMKPKNAFYNINKIKHYKQIIHTDTHTTYLIVYVHVLTML